MSRLKSMLMLDLRLQQRYRFFYAAIFVTLVWIAFMYTLPASAVKLAIPYVIFGDLAVIGFFFIAGQVIYEKTERTLYALVVSPLSFGEYLASKLTAYTLMGLLVSYVLVIAGSGRQFSLIYLSLAVILGSLINTLTGFIAVAPYRSISSFLVPSQLYLLVLGLPLIHFVGWVDFPLFYAVPSLGTLYLLKGAFGSITVREAIYGILIQVLWIVILIRISRSRFESYIVAQRGGHAQ